MQWNESHCPAVSVVMGVYNGGDSVSRTIESVLGQENVSLELICVDDGSTDMTGGILKRHADADERVFVIRQENAGLTRALIRGCAEARGEYIARQDAGDVSLPGRLARQAAVLAEHSNCVLVSCGFDLVGPDGELLLENCMANEDPKKMKEGLLSGDPSLLKGPAHGTVMFRKSAYEKVGGYRPEFYFSQDMDLWTRLAETGVIKIVPEKLCLREYSAGSITCRYRRKQEQMKRLIAEASKARMKSEDESIALAKASQIRPSGKPAVRVSKSRAAYFVGSCLEARNDPRAGDYFLQSVKTNPLHLKGWIRLLRREFSARASRCSHLETSGE